MPHDSIARSDGLSALRKKVLAFSLLGLVGLVILLALFEPQGVDTARTAARNLMREGPARRTFSWPMAPVFAAAGFGAGFLAGMLGMGGGILKVTCLLLLLRMDIFFARAVSIVTMLVSSVMALRHYHRAGLVTWPYARPMVLMGILGAVLGAVVGNQLKSVNLFHLYGFFMVFLAFNTLALVFGDPDEGILAGAFSPRPRHRQGYLCASIGALHGSVCGLLGISGGVIATPMQQNLLQVPMRNAIANTLLVSVVVTAVGGIIVVWTGLSRGDFLLWDLLLVDLFMGSGAVLGAPLGARLGQGCQVTILRLLFVALTMGAGLSIIF